MREENKIDIELAQSGEAKAIQKEEKKPLFEMRGYKTPKSFGFAFCMSLANTSLLIVYPILAVVEAIVFAFLAKFGNLSDMVFVFLCALTGVLLTFALIMDLLLPLIMKKNLARMPKLDLRFFEGMMEMVSLVEADGKTVGGIKMPIAYSSFIKIKRFSSYVFIVFPYNGKRGTLGLEKSQMPEGLLEFLLKQKK